MCGGPCGFTGCTAQQANTANEVITDIKMGAQIADEVLDSANTIVKVAAPGSTANKTLTTITKTADATNNVLTKITIVVPVTPGQ